MLEHFEEELLLKYSGYISGRSYKCQNTHVEQDDRLIV